MSRPILQILLFLCCGLLACSTSEVETKPSTSPKAPTKSQTQADTMKKPAPHPQKKISIEKDFVLGKFDYRKHKDFVKLAKAHSSKTIYLQKETYAAFKRMADSAKKENIQLIVISGTRNFYEQKGIWERKWKKYMGFAPLARAEKILCYSSMPMSSRHHWGTDMDINSLENSYFAKGRGLQEYKWLQAHAHKFGFYQTYTSKDGGRTGYQEEKWHWSYGPLASQYLAFYNENVSYDDIAEFNGSGLAKEIDIIKNYVNGIGTIKNKKTILN